MLLINLFSVTIIKHLITFAMVLYLNHRVCVNRPTYKPRLVRLGALMH